jgi:hypothetical protein
VILQHPTRFQEVLLAILFNPLTDWAWDWLLGWGRWAPQPSPSPYEREGRVRVNP